MKKFFFDPRNDGPEKQKSPLRRNVRGTARGRMGFIVVILLMFSTAVLLTVAASNRTAGAAWGSLPDNKHQGPEEFVLPPTGFIVIDMSKVNLDENGNELNLSERGNKRAEDMVSTVGAAWRLPFGAAISSPSRQEEYSPFGWKFPERLVASAESEGVANGLFSNSGFSRLSGFAMRMPERLAVGGLTAGISSGLYSNSGLSSITPSLYASDAEAGILQASPAGTAQDDSLESGGLLPKELSDYDNVVLSAAQDGKTLNAGGDEGPEEPEKDEVILAEVKPSWREYYVKAGETMSDIAESQGIAVNHIVRANELKDPDRLSEKQLLLVPNTPEDVDATLEEVRTRKARVLAAIEEVVPVKVTAYVVASGDSLWSIASAQNIEVDTIFGSNDLKSPDRLRPGMTLRIPNQDGLFYRIKKGETLDKIAKKYGISISRIGKSNPGLGSGLKEGTEIFLPGARPEAVEEEPAAKAPSKPAARIGAREPVIRSFSRSYRWPVVGKINSPFGWRRHPVTRRRDFHTGLDIKAPRGRGIAASKAGKVAYSGWMGGYGRVLVVDHGDGFSSLYAHCSSLMVGQGQRVSQGQTVATVGTSGRTTGPHLHFEVRRGQTPVNPLSLLR